MDKLLIIDGNSLANRAFYALPLLSNKDGEYSNVIYGFMNILIKFITEQKPTHIAVAFDHSRKTFRNEIYEDYKAGRKKMPDELRVQMPMLKAVLKEMGIKVFEVPGIEADDIIGSIAKNCDAETIILSGDRDVLQLIDNTTCVWLTKKGISEVLEVNKDTIKEIYGCYADQVIDMKAIMGDSSDNIPGVFGIGEVGAKNLIEEFGNLDNIYNNIEKIKERIANKLLKYKREAYMSRTLATIKTDADVKFDINDCGYNFPFNKKILKIFNKYEFKSIIKRKELFEQGAFENIDIDEDAEKNPNKKTEIILENIEQLKNIINTEKIDFFAFDFDGKIEFSFNEINLYKFNTEINLFNLNSIDTNAVAECLLPIIENQNILKITQDIKSQMHKINLLSKIKGEVFDINLAKYLLFSGAKINRENEVFDFKFIMEKLMQEMQKLELVDLYKNIELPLVFVLFDMENQGFKINTTMLDELSENYKKEQDRVVSKIYELAGEEFNINSPKVLGAVLFDKLKLSDWGNKKHSTNIDVLTELQGEHEIVSLVIRYRKIQKLTSTYLDVYKNLVQKNGDIIYTIFNQTLTSTGRLSSSEPNLQNIPVRDEEGKYLRKLFISRFEEGQIISADYNQIELRLLANFSKDKNMIDGYKHNADIHRATASKIFGVSPDSVDDFMRRAAKSVNFGIVYGMSSFGLAGQLGIPRSQAQEFIDRYLATYPLVMRYMNSNITNAQKYGYTKTMYGRIRRINELFSSNKNIRRVGERMAMNAPLQGSASDIIKIAMINVYNKLKQKNMKSKLILQIHDELIIDAHKDEIEEVKQLVKTEMENVAIMEVPLVVSANSGNTWFDAH